MIRIPSVFVITLLLSGLPCLHAQVTSKQLPAVFSAASAQAGEPKPSPSLEPKKTVELRFIIKEVEGGKVINSREYKTRTQANNQTFDVARIRTGSKMPLETGSVTGTTGTQHSIQYLDVGINFDCTDVHTVDGHLVSRVKAEITSYVDGSQPLQPVIRQNSWDGEVDVVLGKPTTIFSSDDVLSKRSYQVELTASPLQ